MIQTGITELLIYYVIVLVAVISAIAVLGALVASWKRRKRRAAIVGCTICGEYYPDPQLSDDTGEMDGHAPVECPNCGALNERRSLRRV